MIEIENWSIVESATTADNAYLAPERRLYCLNGNVYGHPNFEDGESINTSSLEVLEVNNKYAKTRSGNEYQLGEPHPDYVAYCKEMGSDALK